LPARSSIAWFPLALRSLAILLLLAAPFAVAQSPLEIEILRQTNAYREQYGLEPLAWDEAAHKAALAHARDMLARHYFAHETPEGVTPAERMWRAGVLEVTVGENIAYYGGLDASQAAAKVVADWMNSPHHRENILRPQFTHLGVAVSQAGDRVMLVQDFLARPFKVLVWRTPSQKRVGVLEYGGSSRATVGVFVNGVYRTALQPPDWRGELELDPGSRVSLGLWRDGAYYLACSFVPPRLDCANPKIAWSARYHVELRDTVQLQLTLPPGEYTLAYGKEDPVPFKKVNGQVFLEVPRDWMVIWVGLAHGDRVEYTHRIPLER